MHKKIPKKTIKVLVIIAMIIALGSSLCVNFSSKGDISVFNRAEMV